MSSVRLTPASYIVLGLLDQAGTATPYDLKAVAEVSVFHFWTVPHTQVYAECARLAKEGLLSERREEEGRRRRFYSLTKAGRAALAAWLAEPPDRLYELRDPGLIKLFFGADPATLAASELESHRTRLAAYEELLAQGLLPDGMQRALRAGIGHEREYVRFWRSMAADAE